MQQNSMNLSGMSVRELVVKYEVDITDLLVMWDEVQLPLGIIRIHPDGSAGSHNGAQSVINALGTQEFARLRLGCGPNHPLNSRPEHVLRPIRKVERDAAAELMHSPRNAA